MSSPYGIKSTALEHYLAHPCPECGEEKLFIGIQTNPEDEKLHITAFIECDACMFHDATGVSFNATDTSKGQSSPEQSE